MHFQESAVSDALYAERTPGGYLAVTPNLTGEETEVDLEVLFNAVVSNRAQVQQLFEPSLKTI